MSGLRSQRNNRLEWQLEEGAEAPSQATASELNHQSEVHQRLAAERSGTRVVGQLTEVAGVAEVHVCARIVKGEVVRLQRVLEVPPQLGVPALREPEVLLGRNLCPLQA